MRHVNGDWWPDRDEACHNVCYDLNGAEIAASYCEQHELVIQAGGNVGVWPRFLRGMFSNVWTFEPSRENYELMLRNLKGLDVRAWNAALGEKRGICSMSFNPRNCGDDRTQPGKGTEVLAIDDLGVKPDLIYLDVQGDELKVLLGAKATLERSQPVVAIEHDRECVEQRGDPIPLLVSLGYKQIERYGQDRIFSTRPVSPYPPERPKLLRKFKTRQAAMTAMRKAPEGTDIDYKRMTWRHKNGSKTHFVVGD